MVKMKCPNCGTADDAIEILDTDNEELYFHDGKGYVNDVCHCNKCHATFWANIDFKIQVEAISYEMIDIEEPEDETEEEETGDE